MRKLLFLLLLMTMTLFALEVQPGELWRITLEVTEGEVTLNQEMDIMIGEGGTFVTPGRAGVYETQEKGITLYQVRNFSSFVNGKANKKVGADKMELSTERVFHPFDSTTSWICEFTKIAKKESLPGTKDGVCFGIGLDDLLFLYGDSLFTYNRDVRRVMPIVSFAEDNIEVQYENGTTKSKCIKLTGDNRNYRSTADFPKLVDSLAPIHESESAENMEKLYTVALPDSLMQPYDYYKTLLQFVYNDYGFLTEQSMRTLYYLMDFRFNDCTAELLALIPEYAKKHSLTIESTPDRVPDMLRKKRIVISEDDPARITKGLFLLYLRETIKPKSRQHRKIFKGLQTLVVHYPLED